MTPVNRLSLPTSPHLEWESRLTGLVCGIDEAGRGPLAGPVFAAAVVLNRGMIPEGLQDSKKLSASRRKSLFQQLLHSATIGVGIASVEDIDRINIFQATMLAMQRACHALPNIPDYALIDGNKAPNLPCQTITLVKGDSISLSIAAASIIAKHLRDEAMAGLNYFYPVYEFHRHAGYSTAMHLEKLQQSGISSQHRLTFAPVRQHQSKRDAG